MLKILCGCTLFAMYSLGRVKSASTVDEVREALEKAFEGEDDLSRLDDYLDFISKYDKLNGIDLTNTDELRSRFLNWKATDDTILAGKEDLNWKLGHTKFSDWSREEKTMMVMDETFINDDSRSAINEENCLQVKMTDSSLNSLRNKINSKISYNVDNRGYDVGGIQDQGQCASCWDFSDVSTLEVNRNMDLGLQTDYNSDSFIKLSEQYVLDCINDGIGSCDGGYPIFTLMWINQNNGICASDDYNSYSEEESTCSSSMCETSEGSQYSQLFCLSDETDEQVSYAASTFSITFAFKVYSEFYNYESGIYNCDTNDEFVGWHAVSIVGITDDYYIVKNSWSKDWGDNGYFYMSRDSFNDCSMSHFAFVSFNDITDALTKSNDENTYNELDIANVKTIRSQSQMSKTILRKENIDISNIISKHIKIHGKTNHIVLYILGIIVILSILCIAIGQIIKAIRNCKDNKRRKIAADFSEQSALLDGYVTL